MDSLMGRTGAGTGVGGRALLPFRGRLMGSENRTPKYLSLAHLRSLHEELVALLDSAPGSSANAATLSSKQALRLIEILRSISELVAFGEAGEGPEYFEFFCEKSTMALFVKALRHGPAVKTQVVQGVSILFQNLRSNTSLYMLLSSDHINRLIQPEGGVAELPLDDEEFLTNYVALLKAISVRLSQETVPFFLNTTKGSFPLYSRSIPLIGHPDPMVRTSALSIVLQVFSVKDPGVTAFLALEENHMAFFNQLSRLMQDAYSQILCRMWQDVGPSNVGESTAMEGATSFFQDMLYYIQDVLSIGDALFSEKLALYLHQRFFRPVVLGTLAEAVESKEQGGDGSPCKAGKDEVEAGEMAEERESELQLALYALCQLFMLATDGPLLRLVAADLFGQGDTIAPNSSNNISSPRARAATSYAAPRRESADSGSTAPEHETIESAQAPVTARRIRQHSYPAQRQLPAPTGPPGGSDDGQEARGVDCYRKALLTCVTRQRQQGEQRAEGAQVRLGAIAVLWSAVKNPSPLVAEIVLEGAATPAASDRPAGTGGVASGNGATGGGGGGSRGCSGGDTSAVVSRSSGCGGTVTAEHRPRIGCFEQLMVCLLEALIEPPPADTVAVRTAVALVEELCVLQVSSCSRCRNDGGGGDKGNSNSNSNSSGGINARDYSIAHVGGDSAAIQPLPPAGLWAHGTRNQRYAVMLTDVYARCAEILLGATTRLHPFALLAACEHALELLGVSNIDIDEDTSLSFPPPRLADVAGSGLLLGGDEAAARGVGWGGGFPTSRVAGSEESDLRTFRVQNFLLLRSLHHWLVGASTALDEHTADTTAAAIAAAVASPLIGTSPALSTESLGPPKTPPHLNPPLFAGSLRVDAEFLGLVGVVDDVDQDGIIDGQGGHTRAYSLSSSAFPEEASSCAVETLSSKASGGEREAGSFPTSTWGSRRSQNDSVNGTSGTADVAPPRQGGRVQLSGKLCLACCLPFNWPGTMAASPAAATRITTAEVNAKKSAAGGPASMPAQNGGSGGGASRRANGGGGGMFSGLLSGPALWAAPATPNGAGDTGRNGFNRNHHQREQQQQHFCLDDPAPDELSVILDERNFMIVVPDPPYSPLHGGFLLCVAPLRNTTAKVHPANPRVLELRVSTREEARMGSMDGPGLFLPVPGGAAAGGGVGTVDGGASFRGAGHLGSWHLVLSFKNAGSCRMVAEHVEERREAILSSRTVGLVEMFRRVAAMATSNNAGVYI